MKKIYDAIESLLLLVYQYFQGLYQGNRLHFIEIIVLIVVGVLAWRVGTRQNFINKRLLTLEEQHNYSLLVLNVEDFFSLPDIVTAVKTKKDKVLMKVDVFFENQGTSPIEVLSYVGAPIDIETDNYSFDASTSGSNFRLGVNQHTKKWIAFPMDIRYAGMGFYILKVKYRVQPNGPISCILHRYGRFPNPEKDNLLNYDIQQESSDCPNTP